ncbi:MAG: hypothetical protein HY718_06340 [Planctomycetes bacterium]|nr:hypothetical protein [Planctomycetota bacterium]
MRRIWVSALALVVVGAAPAAAEPMQGQCLMATPAGVGQITDSSGTRPLEPRSELQSGMKIDTAGGQAWLYLATANESGEATVWMRPDSSMAIESGTDGYRQLRLLGGDVLVRYAAADGRPLVLAADDSWVRLDGGLLWGRVTAAGATWELADGEATRFDGKLPAAGPLPATGGEALVVDPAARERATDLQRALSYAMVADASAKWLVRAERGDLTPTPKGEVTEAAVSQFVVEVAPIVTPVLPSVAIAATVVSSTAGVGLNQAESLLATGNPASVVVGARLERTRVVGSPGTAESGGLRFNSQARGPLRINLR